MKNRFILCFFSYYIFGCGETSSDESASPDYNIIESNIASASTLPDSSEVAEFLGYFRRCRTTLAKAVPQDSVLKPGIFGLTHHDGVISFLEYIEKKSGFSQLDLQKTANQTAIDLPLLDQYLLKLPFYITLPTSHEVADDFEKIIQQQGFNHDWIRWAIMIGLNAQENDLILSFIRNRITKSSPLDARPDDYSLFINHPEVEQMSKELADLQQLIKDEIFKKPDSISALVWKQRYEVLLSYRAHPRYPLLPVSQYDPGSSSPDAISIALDSYGVFLWEMAEKTPELALLVEQWTTLQTKHAKRLAEIAVEKKAWPYGAPNALINNNVFFKHAINLTKN